MNNDIRCKQRFQNFQNAFSVFNRRIDGYKLDRTKEAEQMALIQSFEIIFELAWKVLKDYLESEGLNDAATPKKAIRHAFQVNLITDAETWLKSLENINLTTHTYNQETARQLLQFIEEKFYVIMSDLHSRLEKEL